MDVFVIIGLIMFGILLLLYARAYQVTSSMRERWQRWRRKRMHRLNNVNVPELRSIYDRSASVGSMGWAADDYYDHDYLRMNKTSSPIRSSTSVAGYAADEYKDYPDFRVKRVSSPSIRSSSVSPPSAKMLKVTKRAPTLKKQVRRPIPRQRKHKVSSSDKLPIDVPIKDLFDKGLPSNMFLSSTSAMRHNRQLKQNYHNLLQKEQARQQKKQHRRGKKKLKKLRGANTRRKW